MPVPSWSPCLSLCASSTLASLLWKDWCFLELSLQRELSVCIYSYPPHTLCVEHEPHADNIHIHTRMTTSVHTCTRSHPYVCTMNHSCMLLRLSRTCIHTPSSLYTACVSRRVSSNLAKLHRISNLSQRRFDKRGWSGPLPYIVAHETTWLLHDIYDITRYIWQQYKHTQQWNTRSMSSLIKINSCNTARSGT